MKNNKGFSLVELIVVIAIMAILAAVAVIGVSVYIPRAQEANDKELLNIMSDALTSACLSEGIDQRDITASVTVLAEGKLADATGHIELTITSSGLTDAQKDKIEEIFNSVLSDDKAAFNLVDAGRTIWYRNGKFALGNSVLNYGGATIVLDQADIDALNNSTFGGMGIDKLLNQLDQVTGIAADMSSSAYMNVIKSEGFLNSALLSMGVEQTEIDGMTQGEKLYKLQTKRDELAKKALADQGITDPSDDQIKAAGDQIQANAVVLYTAQITSKMDSATVDSLLDTSTKEQIIANMNSGDKSGDGIAQAALMCGLYTSYVNSSYGAHLTPAQKEVNPGNVLDAMENDTQFDLYLKSDQGKKDLEGYLGSLGMISSSTSDPNATNSLIVNGFADPDLIAGLNQATGK